MKKRLKNTRLDSVYNPDDRYEDIVAEEFKEDDTIILKIRISRSLLKSMLEADQADQESQKD